MVHKWYHFLQLKEIYHNEGNNISEYFYNKSNHSKVRLNMESKVNKIKFQVVRFLS